jgi:microcystin-dependent protein
MDGIVGMIKMVLSLNATAAWLPCDGRLLQAADYPALFALVGNRFGGDGLVDFALPIVPSQEAAHFMIKVAPTPQDAAFQGLVAQMVLWVGAELPADWLPCDGRLVQGSDYPLLQKVAAQGANGVPMAAFHLPAIPAGPGLQYMICVHGLDPSAGAGPKVMSDDDY